MFGFPVAKIILLSLLSKPLKVNMALQTLLPDLPPHILLQLQ